MTDRYRPLVGMTMGDPAGIGPEIVYRALERPRLFETMRPLVIGDARILKKAMAITGAEISVSVVNTPEDGVYTPGTIDVMVSSDLDTKSVEWGRPTPATGQAMIGYINRGVDLAMEGRIDALATGPVNKAAMKLAGSRFHGHTELLAFRTEAKEYAMMMAGERLRVVLVTIHMPLKDVSGVLNRSSVLNVISLTARSLKERFGVSSPRIAVAGFNPHAGEEEMFGSEEVRAIRPAVTAAVDAGIDAVGPLPPDTLFYHAAKGVYDAVVCMYHDQGLIPFKMLHFEDGVNVTLGLPIIRTSVDHGTAYDIAGRGTADPGSLVAALEMAARQALFKMNQAEKA